MAKDILVKTGNPELLDKTLQSMGAVVVEASYGYKMVNGCYVVRVFGDPEFVKFAIEQQGYGKIAEFPIEGHDENMFR